MAHEIIRLLAPVLATVLFLFPVSGWAKTWYANLDTCQGSVSFDAIGRPSMLRIHGEGGAPRGLVKVEEGKVTGTITFDLDSLDTGIKLRNRHMREKYLETAKHPKATFAFTKMVLPRGFGNAVKAAEAVPFEGVLTVHGVQQPVKGTASFEVERADVDAEANFETKVSAYQIETPSFAGVTVADSVKVKIRFKVKAKDRP